MIKEKRYVRVLGILITFMLMMSIISVFSCGAKAAEVKDLATLDRDQDIIITVSYEKEKPSVAFISPSGRRYESEDDFDHIEEEGKVLNYYISGAREGDWEIEYDKKSNDKIEVGIMTWHKTIKLNSFTFETENDDDSDFPIIKGTVNATYPDGRYRFVLYGVVLDENDSIVKKIRIGNEMSGYSDDDNEFTVLPDSLPDGEYRIMIDVYASDITGTEAHDTAIAAGKYVMSGNTVSGSSDCLDIECVVNDSTIYYVFDTSETDIRCDEYTVVITQDGDDDLLYTSTFSEYKYENSVIFDSTLGDVTITVSAKDRSGKYIRWEKKVSPKMPFDMALESPESSNSTIAVFSYDAGSESYKGTITLNGSSSGVVFNGSNKLQLTVEPMIENVVEISAENDGVKYTSSYKLYVDNIPPVIDLYGVSGDMTTSEKVIVFVGKTEASAKLTCNGSDVELDENGAFTITLDVSDGENVFLFEAQDNAGNVASRTVRVTKGGAKAAGKTKTSGSGGIGRVLAIIGGAAAMVLALFLAGFMSERRSAKKGLPSKPYRAVALMFINIFTAASLGTGIYQLIRHKKGKDKLTGSELIELLKNSTTSEIAELIRSNTSHLYNALICFGAALAVTLVMITITIVKHVIKKKRSKSAQSDKQ